MELFNIRNMIPIDPTSYLLKEDYRSAEISEGWVPAVKGTVS